MLMQRVPVSHFVWLCVIAYNLSSHITIFLSSQLKHISAHENMVFVVVQRKRETRY